VPPTPVPAAASAPAPAVAAAPAVPYRQGAGEPLVLLHGFTDTWRAWKPVLPALSQHHEVFAWSLPGHFGGDPWDMSVPITVRACADILERQMDALGLGQAHIAGNSLGGWLSLELAARGRALTAVGVCPAGGWEPGSRDEHTIAAYFTRTAFLLRWAGPLLPFVARHATLRRVALRDVVADGRRVPTDAALAMFEGARGCTIVKDVLSLVGTPGIFDLEQIHCPVRILYGSRDRLLRWPSYYSRMQQDLPDADWVCLDGLGHIPMWDDPELVAARILEHTGGRTAQADAPDAPESAA
jgi:pimeloyl-ACP methyl ester carboxylesterase